MHLSFTAANTDSELTVWYAKRTADGVWSFETAIDSPRLADTRWADSELELTSSGQPVLFTEDGFGARRDASGDWHFYDAGHEVFSFALQEGVAYLAFRIEAGPRAPLHIDTLEL